MTVSERGKFEDELIFKIARLEDENEELKKLL